MFNLIVATQNLHKIKEMQPLFITHSIHLRNLTEMENIPEISEDGNSFKENAAIKARICYEAFKRPVMADDSGLEVRALNNAPGIYSARYGGAHADYDLNNRVLLQKMASVPDDQRQARFVCTICYKDESGEYFFTGTAEGVILKELSGKKGFGYDPLFYIPELQKTFAQLSMEEKNRLSHRGKAVRKLITFLDKQIKYLT